MSCSRLRVSSHERGAVRERWDTFYLYLTNISATMYPQTDNLRSIAHFAFFRGFVRK